MRFQAAHGLSVRQPNSLSASVVVHAGREAFSIWTRLGRFALWSYSSYSAPEELWHQTLAISSAESSHRSQSKDRIGFSGTPSDLMPRELGECGYEPGMHRQ
eukprot:1320534-Amphidinium_carterae.1